MTNRQKMGQLGEKLFIKLFGGEQSSDLYDRQKDVILYQQYIEIKTQSMHPTKQMFSITDAETNDNGDIIGVDNIIKCFNVERLIFIQYDHSSILTLWECPQPRIYERYTTSKGKKMIGFPVSQMQMLCEHDDYTLTSQIRSLSNDFRYKI
jgi:hypothetical protein